MRTEKVVRKNVTVKQLNVIRPNLENGKIDRSEPKIRVSQKLSGNDDDVL